MLHFDTPLQHARHYLGYARDGRLEERLEEHRAGRGARLMEVCRERDITWRLVRTWPGGRDVERKLKNRKNAPRLCPVCRAQLNQ